MLSIEVENKFHNKKVPESSRNNVKLTSPSVAAYVKTKGIHVNSLRSNDEQLTIWGKEGDPGQRCPWSTN